MNIKLSAIKRYEVMLYLFFMIVPVAAEEENQIIIEDIFQEIMLTLPPDIKADLDTVKKFSVNATSQKNGSEKVKNENAVELLLDDEQYKALPGNVQKQVESAIHEIDKNREDREVQFKEMKKNNGEK